MTVILRMFKDRKISLVVYSVAAIGFLWMYVAVYPSIGKQAEQFTKLYESYPESLMKAFGIDKIDLTSFENFISIEHFSLIWPIMLAILLISIASGSFAGEIERGTNEMVLSRPISRARLFAGRYLFGVCAMVLFVVVSVFAVLPLAALHGVDVVAGRFLFIAALGALFGLAVFSVSLLVSALVSERGRVSMIMGGLLVVMYVLNVVAALKENLSDLRYLSFFHYFDYQTVLTKGTITATSIWVFSAVIVVSTIAGVLLWKRRDV